jgi:hypothetical protein
MNSRAPPLPRIPQVLEKLYGDYAKTAALVQNVAPPTYSVEPVNQWLNLFNSRGEALYNATQNIQDINNNQFDRVTAAYDLEKYGSQTNTILPLASQIGVSSCP